jgi:hypothetical protein
MALSPEDESIMEQVQEEALELVQFGMVINGMSYDALGVTEQELVKLGITGGITATFNHLNERRKKK